MEQELDQKSFSCHSKYMQQTTVVSYLCCDFHPFRLIQQLNWDSYVTCIAMKREVRLLAVRNIGYKRSQQVPRPDRPAERNK